MTSQRFLNNNIVKGAPPATIKRTILLTNKTVFWRFRAGCCEEDGRGCDTGDSEEDSSESCDNKIVDAKLCVSSNDIQDYADALSTCSKSSTSILIGMLASS